MNREKIIRVLVNDTERERIEQAAAQDGRSLSSFIRQATLRQITASSTVQQDHDR